MVLGGVGFHAHDLESIRALRASIVLLVSLGCGGAPDLPPVVATSDHFRYHARSSAEVPDGLLSELEAHRTDVLTYFGQLTSQTGRIIDYYHFAAASDRDQNSPCGAGHDCEDDGKVYSTMAAEEFELVHAYLSGVGRPPRLFQEGMGAVVSWANFNEQLGPIAGDWTQAATDDGRRGYIQTGGYLLSLYLLRTYGPQRLISYYAWADQTEDPAFLDLQFQTFWGRSIASIWDLSGGGVSIANPPNEDPINPCARGALANSGEGVDFPFVADGVSGSIPLDVPEDEALLLAFQATPKAQIQDCLRNEPAMPIANSAPGKRGLAMVRPAPGSYFVSTPAIGVQTVSSLTGSWLAATCVEASATPVPSDVDAVSVLVPAPTSSSGGTTWYVHLSLDTPRLVTMLASDAVVAKACAGCDGTQCTSLSTPQTQVTGDLVFELDVGSPASQTMNQWIELQFE